MYQKNQTNSSEEDQKRFFFGAEVDSSWPLSYPDGRLIKEEMRHMTLAFLGNQTFDTLSLFLSSFPSPSFKTGPVGKYDRILFLPRHHSRVVCFHVQWFNQETAILQFQKDLLKWLQMHQYPVDTRDFLPHVSVARAPFDKKKWEESFVELPMMIKAFHLYESLGNLNYISRFCFPLVPPFEEFHHTADIAFYIRGETMEQIHLHALIALCFKFPPMLPFIHTEELKGSVNAIVSSLNYLIADVDAEIGSPFKAVSYHGEAKKTSINLFEWEMIVDV